MHKIAFLIALSNKYYNAGTKPFLDISLGLINNGYKPFLLFFKSPSYEDCKKRFPNLPMYAFQDVDEINNFINKEGIKVLISDDYIYRLKILNKIKAKYKVVYVQHLAGMSVINELSNKTNIKLKLASYLPWRITVRQYVNILEKANIIIGNSYAATHYLASLYGISSSGVVYPPVGVNLRLLNNSERKGILVYVGHKPDFYVRDLKQDIKVLKNIDDDIIIWGEGGLENISDEELSHLYSRVKLVYVTTTFETFGYVGAEALLFGTPVLLNVYQPFLEKIPLEYNMVKILGRKEIGPKEIEDFLELEKDIISAKKAIISNYSANKSSQSLIKILDTELTDL
jgi:hypothetical protein